MFHAANPGAGGTKLKRYPYFSLFESGTENELLWNSGEHSISIMECSNAISITGRLKSTLPYPSQEGLKALYHIEASELQLRETADIPMRIIPVTGKDGQK